MDKYGLLKICKCCMCTGLCTLHPGCAMSDQDTVCLMIRLSIESQTTVLKSPQIGCLTVMLLSTLSVLLRHGRTWEAAHAILCLGNVTPACFRVKICACAFRRMQFFDHIPSRFKQPHLQTVSHNLLCG